MSQIPSGALPATLPIVLLPGRLLRDGEIIILAIKPSLWYVPLVSWPVLAVAVLLPLVIHAAGRMFHVETPVNVAAVTTICAAAAVARLCAAMYQWTARLYVLTNLRIMRVRGLVQFDVFDCPLAKIRQVVATAMLIERPLGLGSLVFELKGEADGIASAAAQEHSWIHVARVQEVHAIVSQTIGRT